MKTNNKKGFTLVELVIVIAVIAILSAILVPTFGTVISNANESKRQEDARTAYQTFLIEHVEQEVPAGTPYILFKKKSSNEGEDKISTTTLEYAYSVENGTVKSVGAEDSGMKDAAKFTESNTTVDAEEAPTEGSIAASTVYKLGNNMYIVFAATPTSNP